MNFEIILNDKSLKPKEKTLQLCEWILSNSKASDALLHYSSTSKDAIKATCIEAFEVATKTKPEIISSESFNYFVDCLKEKTPRIKWESARVIGNVASHHQNNFKEAIINLTTNAEHPGTVVRWSAAFALGEILKQKTKLNKDLIPAIKRLCEKEEKNSIKKIYLSALKKTLP